MECDGCGNKKAYRTVKVGNEPEYCDRCGDAPSPSQPDVYFTKPYFDENISHPDVVGHEGGSYITSRGQKAALMKRFGLQESGDRHHGSSGFDRIAHKHAMESLRRKSQ